MDRVRVITGDTGVTPYGGGTWASRGAGIGGEAVLQSGKVLRANILEVAAAILESSGEMLDVRDNNVVDARTGEVKLALTELGRIAYFRPDTLPLNFQSELMVTRHYTPRGYGFAFTNGFQASLVEVDTDTGFVKLLRHWCVEDCGTIINPMLVDEQIRGGIVQGIGAVHVRALPLQPGGTAPERQHRGLPGADGERDARHRRSRTSRRRRKRRSWARKARARPAPRARRQRS